jgi:hypothetical protein
MEKSPKQRVSVVDETDIGVYVWRMPDGRWVGDEDGNFLSIAAQKGDLRRIHELTAAVRSYGVEEGAPAFLPGRRKITDEELEEQESRLSQGLIPDPYDIPALMEELRHGKFDR